MFGGISTPEMLVVGIIALLLFGKKLPEVARSLGKGLTEFKRGMSGVEDDLRRSVRGEPSYSSSASSASRPVPREEQDELTAPKFEPPIPQPVASTSTDDEPAREPNA